MDVEGEVSSDKSNIKRLKVLSMDMREFRFNNVINPYHCFHYDLAFVVMVGGGKKEEKGDKKRGKKMKRN